MEKKYNLGLICFCYFILALFLICLFNQYNNVFVKVICALTFIVFMVHICICAYKNGKKERDFQEKEEYVHKREIEEKYKKYKSEEK